MTTRTRTGYRRSWVVGWLWCCSLLQGLNHSHGQESWLVEPDAGSHSNNSNNSSHETWRLVPAEEEDDDIPPAMAVEDDVVGPPTDTTTNEPTTTTTNEPTTAHESHVVDLPEEPEEDGGESLSSEERDQTSSDTADQDPVAQHAVTQEESSHDAATDETHTPSHRSLTTDAIDPPLKDPGMTPEPNTRAPETTVAPPESVGEVPETPAHDTSPQEEEKMMEEEMMEEIEEEEMMDPTPEHEPSSMEASGSTDARQDPLPDHRSTPTLQEATPEETGADEVSPVEYPLSHCGIWGRSGRNRPVDVSILYTFFQYNVLGHKPVYNVSDPHVEATRLADEALRMARDNASEMANQRRNELVDGLDDIDKFFEGVEPPDELDISAGGSSIQEVLMGQGGRILLKRLRMGADLIHRMAETLRDEVMERIHDVMNYVKEIDKEQLERAWQWLVKRSVKLFHATRRAIDEIMEGNFEGILDAFGEEQEDSLDVDSVPSKDTSFYAAQATATGQNDNHQVDSNESDMDAEMEELIRLMGLSPESSPQASATASADGGSSTTAQPSIAPSGTATGAARKPAMDKEMGDLLRQLGI